MPTTVQAHRPTGFPDGGRAGYTRIMQRVTIKRAHAQAMFAEDRKLCWCSTRDKETGKRNVWMSCDQGHWAGLGNDNHTIDKSGNVSPSVVCATKGCKFHSYVTLQGHRPEAPTKVTINGKAIDIYLKTMSYDQAMEYAGIVPAPGCSITYKSDQAQGILAPGDTVTVVDGMIINAMFTGNA